MIANDLYTIDISLSCIVCSGLSEKSISLTLKLDELLRYAVNSQAFLEAVYGRYMYFNPDWLRTLTQNVSHSATYSLSFRLLVICLQEHFSPTPTWNFNSPRGFWLHSPVRASELHTGFSNITHSSMYFIFYCIVKSHLFIHYHSASEWPWTDVRNTLLASVGFSWEIFFFSSPQETFICCPWSHFRKCCTLKALASGVQSVRARDTTHV